MSNTELPEPDFMLDGGRLSCYYGGTVANLLSAERERCALLENTWAGEIALVRAVALEHVPHAYEGDCPDELDRTRRDRNCPACQILGAA